MRVLIKHNKKDNLLTTKTFNSLEEAKLEQKSKIRYWNRIIKANKNLTTIHLNKWKKAVFLEIDFEQNFDCGFTYSETTKGVNKGLDKKANFIKERVIQERIENNFNNQSKIKRFTYG